MKRSTMLRAVFLALAVATLTVTFGGVAAANTPVNGAVRTTVNEAVDGTGHCQNGNPAVNCNLYDGKQYVWLSGAPLASSLSDGCYLFDVLVPGGQGGHLNPNDGTPNNLSDLTPTSSTGAGDAWTNRVFCISGGVLTYSGTHDFNGNKIRLMPYDDTTNPGGVYILAVCNLADRNTLAANQPGVNPSDCKYDAFKVQPATPPPNATPPVITKDAAGSYDKTYSWNIHKSVDQTEVHQSGTTVTLTYTVSVSHGGGTVSHVQVNGTIEVFNPNNGSISNATIADTLSDGTVCSVTGGNNITLPGLSNSDFAYSCGLTGLPQGQLDNTATVSWGQQQVVPDGALAAGTASFTFSNIQFDQTTIDGCVSVSDPYDPNSPRSFCVGDAGDPNFTYSYERVVTGTAGTCTTFDNTATFTTDTTGTTGSASTRSKLCVGSNLTVSKTATPAFHRTYNWDIGKNVDKSYIQTVNNTVTANYAVTASETGYTDSGWQVTGTIHISNPNDWEAISLTGVSDSIDNGGSCSITSGNTTGSVPANGSVDLGYTCTYASAPNPAGFTNTATASWDKVAAHTPDGSASGTATGAFSAPTSTTNKTVTVTDTNVGTLGTLTATDTTPYTTHTYTYSRTLNVPASGCTTYPNTAAITETGQSSSASVKVCRLLGNTFTIGFWQNKNGQALIVAHPSWCTALASYPNVLTGFPASCTGSSLAAYVYSVIKLANSSGDGVAMLKAQFLAMALNALNTPSVGTTNIDLSGELTSGELSALGISSCVSVNNFLAAINSTVGSWSGNKTYVTDIQSALNTGNNGNQLTC